VPVTGWELWADAQLQEIKANGRWRQLRVLEGKGPGFVCDGRPVVSFASNDYLGLSDHPAVRAAAADAVGRSGTGSGSSRLIVGNRDVHAELEELIADWTGAEAALVFATGYQANLGVITTLGSGALIVSDELNHASIIDGARLARSRVAVYRHGDLDQAADLVASAPGRALLVTDTVFSMDGDAADVTALSELCSRWDAMLVLDDAHAVFDRPAVAPLTSCVRVGTLSKALGSQGGYVVGERRWIDLLINRARSFIFSTGLAPASVAAAGAAIEICRSPEGDHLRAVLRGHTDTIRMGHPSPIIPVVMGEESRAVAAADRLLCAGLLVPAIRPPTVPPGTSRLRVSLSSAHEKPDVARLAKALAEL
jgi:8-amino-7-oxononanoate synthase